MDIVALKTAKLRGQAWVVFSEVPAASNAVRQMQNFPFYDKPLVSQSTDVSVLHDVCRRTSVFYIDFTFFEKIISSC